MEYKLTIALITMNRAQQLKNAVESCAQAKLPPQTQFVIVDNASMDDTQQIVEELKKSISYDIVYQKEDVNRGAGLGRNICFDLARGEYVFFLDDDAEIHEDCYETFFMKSIAYLDKNTKVASLTTNIIDTVFGERKSVVAKSEEIDSLKSVYTFHEGTVFFRKKCFSQPLYLDIMYGSEGLYVSTNVRNNGFYNVYDPMIFIKHNPKIDKWHNSEKDRLNMQGISNIYGIKKMLYPTVFLPVLYMVFLLRIKRNGIKDKKLIAEFKQKRNKFCKEQCLDKIKIKTVIKAYKQFGMTVF